MKTTMISNPAVSNQNRAEMNSRAPWSRVIKGVVTTALIVYLSVKLMAPLPAHATEASTTDQPPAKQPVATAPAAQSVSPFTGAAANTQPMVAQFGKPDGLFFLRQSLCDSILTGEQTYTVMLDGTTFTLRFIEKGDNVNGEIYAGRNVNPNLRIGAGFGNDFWGAGALGNYDKGKWALVYNESGSRGTITGAVNYLLSREFNASLKLSMPVSAKASPSAVLGGDFAIGSRYQLGVWSTLGTLDEVSAYIMGKYPWGKVVLDGINIGRDDTTYRVTLMLPTH